MVPVPLLHNLKHNKVLHQRIVLLHVVTASAPRIAPQQRIETAHLGDNFHSVKVRYGFMEQPNIPRALEACSTHQLDFAMMETSFFVGRVTIVAGIVRASARSNARCLKPCIATRYRRRNSSASRRAGSSSLAARWRCSRVRRH